MNVHTVLSRPTDLDGPGFKTVPNLHMDVRM